MSRPRARLGVLSDDHYIGSEPRPRVGHPPRHDVEAWTVTDDWSRPVPITDAELDVSEAWFGDLFDELFGPRPTMMTTMSTPSPYDPRERGSVIANLN